MEIERKLAGSNRWKLKTIIKYSKSNYINENLSLMPLGAEEPSLRLLTDILSSGCFVIATVLR